MSVRIDCPASSGSATVVVSGSATNWVLVHVPTPAASLLLWQQLTGFGRILLTLGVDKKDCEDLLAVWQDIVSPTTLFAERQAKMLELIGLIRPLTALPKVQDELWRLQKLLTNYN